MGYDLHRLIEGRPLVLGGVTVPSERGGTRAFRCRRDLSCRHGRDPRRRQGRRHRAALSGYRSALERRLEYRDPAKSPRRGLGLAVANVDVVVILERPKIGPYRDEIESRLAGAIGIDVSRVSVKGKDERGRGRCWPRRGRRRPRRGSSTSV